jgi:O-antigen ligase
MTLSKLNGQSLYSFPLLGLSCALIAIFLFGGSSRWDVQSLVLLNPLMVVCCGVGLLSYTSERQQEKKMLLVSFGILLVLVMIYLVPLPAQVISSIRSSSENTVIRSSAIANTSQILAMSSPSAWQSLFCLFAPLAVLIFAIQLDRKQLQLVLPIMILIGTISGILGVMQLAGSPVGTLYFYRITNSGSAVGLFANRNHAAVFLACLFPMLAVFAAKPGVSNYKKKITQSAAIMISIILVPIILVTGSRSGILCAIIGIIGGVFLFNSYAYSQHRKITYKWRVTILGLLGCLLMVCVTLFFARAEAVDRFFDADGLTDARVDFWASSMGLFQQYFPFGFGPGSFAPAFQQQEQVTMLNATYLNRMHNDWIETGLSFGAVGILLMLVALMYYSRRSFQLWVQMDGTSSTVTFGRMASVIFAILAVASISDYPLRTPAIASFAVLTLVWFADVPINAKPREREKIQHQKPI